LTIQHFFLLAAKFLPVFTKRMQKLQQKMFQIPLEIGAGEITRTCHPNVWGARAGTF